MSEQRPTTAEGWAALLPREPPPDTGPKKLRPGQVYAHGISGMGCMIGEVGKPEVGPACWDNGKLVNPEGYAFKRLAGDYTDALTFVTDECYVSRFFVLLFDTPLAPVKREPVAPWVRMSAGVPEWAHSAWECSVGEYDGTCVHEGANGPPAVYVKEEGQTGACEACAERAGVFGPVNALDEPIMVDGLPYKRYEVATFSMRIQEPPTKWLPACSGPLSTHGTPALRVMMWRGTKPSAVTICDGCYLHLEREIARDTAIGDEEASPDGIPYFYEPPARVGTVPQSIGQGAGIGIWASRGMR